MYDASKIKQLVEHQGRTINWLAERTGYDPSTVSRKLNDKEPLGQKFVNATAQALDVPTDFFLADAPEPAHAD